MKEFKRDLLNVTIADSAEEMGLAAAYSIRDSIQRMLAAKDEINMMFAAAPSQNTTLKNLLAFDDISWNRINAFHMDEYVGIKPDQRQSFRYYLNAHLFHLKPFKSVNLIPGDADDIVSAVRNYELLLRTNGIDIIVLGIGESGHIAFNDPPEARFDDCQWVRIVDLSDTSRMQQVHDKCFDSFDEVPSKAITVTIPAFMSAKVLRCIVPGMTKAIAIEKTLEGPVSESCPATILRKHEDAALFIDSDSASKLHQGN